MAWLDKLERRLGFLAVPGLMRIVVGLTAFPVGGFTLVTVKPGVVGTGVRVTVAVGVIVGEGVGVSAGSWTGACA